jgi:hypothetical protein
MALVFRAVRAGGATVAKLRSMPAVFGSLCGKPLGSACLARPGLGACGASSCRDVHTAAGADLRGARAAQQPHKTPGRRVGVPKVETANIRDLFRAGRIADARAAFAALRAEGRANIFAFTVAAKGLTAAGEFAAALELYGQARQDKLETDIFFVRQTVTRPLPLTRSLVRS